MDLLRFITAGSVDDGKSTLIGRLLYDSKSILIDQLETLEAQSKNKEDGEIDLALLTDGLRAEREQGITIDVAYKYFSTPRRKFIIADAPGHIQYTRNMVTGASTANLMVVLIDARQGVIEQTRRHSIIASLLGIPHIVVAVNKMDLVGFDASVYHTIVADYAAMARTLRLPEVTYIPMSALKGDNVVDKSDSMPWYAGPSLLGLLEEINITTDLNYDRLRFAVQYVIRPQTEDLHDFRGYAGQVLSGTIKPGDKVLLFPGQQEATIDKVISGFEEVQEAGPTEAVTITLVEDIDLSRGDLITGINDLPVYESEFDALLCWMDVRELQPGNKYLLQHNSRQVRSVIREVQYRLDVNTLEQVPAPEGVKLNDVVKVRIKTQQPLAYDDFNALRANGCAVLIDETSHVTVGGCMLRKPE
ncbi:MAG: sulfate adenylyltransferase [Flavobacteriales bacterium]|nr:sulfate adenylyltransferase [Flavobacteriales bacterium]